MAPSLFNKVAINDVTKQSNNVHLGVHPFYCQEAIRMMEYKGHYGHLRQEELPEWKKTLADLLWDTIPGLQALFFRNGGITLQHSGAFSDKKIVEAATQIIRPFLEGELKLQNIQ